MGLRILQVAIFCACLTLVASQIAEANENGQSGFAGFWSALTGHVILGVPKNTVLIAFCNQTELELGVTMSFGTKRGPESVGPILVDADPTNCATEAIDKSRFKGLPASVSIEVQTGTQGEDATGSISVMSGNANAVFFGTSDYCNDTYVAARDSIQPNKRSQASTCIPLKI